MYPFGILALVLILIFTYMNALILYRRSTYGEVKTCMNSILGNNDVIRYNETTCLFNGTNVLILNACPYKWIVHTQVSTIPPFSFYSPYNNQTFANMCTDEDIERWKYDVPCWYTGINCTTFDSAVKYNHDVDVKFERPIFHTCSTDSRVIINRILFNLFYSLIMTVLIVSYSN